jgi:hypothetical protein
VDPLAGLMSLPEAVDRKARIVPNPADAACGERPAPDRRHHRRRHQAAPRPPVSHLDSTSLLHEHSLGSQRTRKVGSMFGLFRRSGPRPVSEAIARAMEKDSGPASTGNTALLRMVESNGRYSDRKVTYFRVFDSALATERSLDVRGFRDLDDAQSLIIRSGHVERDGAVVLTRAVTVRVADSTIRSLADRSKHADDAHIVVHGETGASANLGAVETSSSEASR